MNELTTENRSKCENRHASIGRARDNDLKELKAQF